MSWQPVAAEDPREMQMIQHPDHSPLQSSEHTHKHKHKRKDKLKGVKKDKKEKHRKHKHKKDKKKRHHEVETISRSGLDMMLSTSPKYLAEIASKSKPAKAPKSAKSTKVDMSPKEEHRKHVGLPHNSSTAVSRPRTAPSPPELSLRDETSKYFSG